jgi:hypothetical protein
MLPLNADGGSDQVGFVAPGTAPDNAQAWIARLGALACAQGSPIASPGAKLSRFLQAPGTQRQPMHLFAIHHFVGDIGAQRQTVTSAGVTRCGQQRSGHYGRRVLVNSGAVTPVILLTASTGTSLFSPAATELGCAVAAVALRLASCKFAELLRPDQLIGMAVCQY